jgi:lipid A 4'-phosphatase
MNNQWLLRPLLRYDTIGFLFCICFFILWPDFDISISEKFYDASAQIFFLKGNVIIESIYQFTHVITVSILLTLVFMIMGSFIIKKPYFSDRRKVFIYLLCACLLGPGLMVNLVLKDNWGRPRPRQTLEFGGDKEFQPPFSPNFECQTCRSFVSGHASMGFYFFSFALLARRKTWLVAPILAGGVIGAVRIAQGGHFFSDVLFSGWVVWFCSLLLYHWFFKRKVDTSVKPDSVSD